MDQLQKCLDHIFHQKHDNMVNDLVIFAVSERCQLYQREEIQDGFHAKT